MDVVYDLAIIGGGVNGCGIARDAAGRGLSVYLCEQNDLASGTSSAATKLIHGGLRYLEYFEFRLVREALMEREVLWRIAPHIIWPLRFVLPHHKGMRPAWLLRLGLFLYDHLGGRELLPPTRSLDLTTDPAGRPLKPGDFRRGFEYSDCWVEDARLVVLNARDAANRGATIRTRTRAVSAARDGDGWTLITEDRRTGKTEPIRAKVLVNAGGPWVGQVLATTLKINAAAGVRLVQGSHIVVRKLYDHDRCYIFQNADNRIIFAIPFEQDFTLIGTTDRDYTGDPACVAATPEEIDYLCQATSEYFRTPVERDDVVWTYSGVRPLYDDGASKAQAATRDYEFVLDDKGGAPLLSIFGGKLTTYRRLAEHALERLAPYLPAAAMQARGWTGKTPLPGGDFAPQHFAALVAEMQKTYPWLAVEHARRLCRLYGTRAHEILRGATGFSSLGSDFGATLTEAEIEYLMRQEWVECADDVVWRRTKLGLRLTQDQISAIDAFVRDGLAAAHAA
ncbi:MAG: glycerol-3-phosphate dehydrogenase [Beijerinckiaceae bacterium]